MFATDTHSSEMEVNVTFVSVGMLGIGGIDPSAVKSEEKFLTPVKNSQLLRQLLAFCFQINKETLQSVKQELRLFFFFSMT